ncbi:glycosyltransferase family 39 protein [Streptomyces sp. NPDC059092]|uniref:glycosyltransferase family 39 protein n=1 Tax=Streptomyces sp. NPDC059092 TaxID=3346725 RepID=UPI0036C009BC
MGPSGPSWGVAGLLTRGSGIVRPVTPYAPRHADRPAREGTEPAIPLVLPSPRSAPGPVAPAPPPAAAPSPRALDSRALAVVAPATLALALGVWGIRRGGTLWGDEAVTYEVAHRAPWQIWHTAGQVDAVHGLYYLLMHGAFGLWDGGLVALRLPSVLAVAAASAGVALLGRALAGERAGLLAGLVLPLLPAVQRYAQEGRSYALVCALVTWASWLLVRALGRPSRRRRWAAYAGVLLTACLLHEFAVLTLFAHGVTVVCSGASRRTVRAWAAAAGAVGAGLLPLALFSTTQSAQVDWIGAPGVRHVLGFAVVSAVGVVCARTAPRGSGAVARHRPAAPPVPRLETLALPLLILPSALLMALTPLRPFYVERYVLSYTVGLALLLGAALDRCRTPGDAARARRRAVSVLAVAAALAALCPVGTHLRTPQSRQNDATAVARAVRESARRGDGLLFMPARRRVWTLARPGEFRGLADLALDRSPVASHTLHGTELPAGRVRARMLAARRIVAVRDLPGQPLEATGPEAVKRAVLRTYFEECGGRTVTRARITVHARRGHC